MGSAAAASAHHDGRCLLCSASSKSSERGPGSAICRGPRNSLRATWAAGRETVMASALAPLRQR
eukprot:138751-Rhodomonas_salina.3